MRLLMMLVGACLVAMAFCNANAAEPPPKKILFDAKVDAESTIVAAPAPAPSLEPGGGYATVKYSIGTTEQKSRLQGLINTIAKALPEQLGNSAGTYTVTLTLTDLAGNALVKEPILSFQWTKERVFLFIDKTVSEARRTNWTGTLINRMPVTTANQRLKFSVEVYAQKDRSLDFELLKKTAKTFSDGALASLFPLPAAALPVLGSVTDLINSMYSNSTKRNLVDQSELAMDTKKTIRAPISFENFEAIPVFVSVETTLSRFGADAIANGKFKSKPALAIFNNTEIPIGGSQPVSIVELISTSTKPEIKSTRALLDSVIPGGSYGEDPKNTKEKNVGVLCGNLYTALQRYLSKYDARAMFWAFNTVYGSQFDKTACVGVYQAELTEVGLD